MKTCFATTELSIKKCVLDMRQKIFQLIVSPKVIINSLIFPCSLLTVLRSVSFRMSGGTAMTQQLASKYINIYAVTTAFCSFFGW